jgi:uncharacterized iron-regulated membrane protein
VSRRKIGDRDVGDNGEERARVNWKDTLAVLGCLLFCLILLLSAGFMIWQLVKYAHPERKFQPWGAQTTSRASNSRCIVAHCTLS